ncbi:MAG: type II secretion system protein GspD [Desulfobacterales bacterium S3730MH5]|nr:MAG: type II secretion system protein GspD [Desulfobacterales bacterium S3730MH5]
MTKRNVDGTLLLFGVVLLAFVFGAGCAGNKSQVRDEGVKAETGRGDVPAKTVEAPTKKTLADDEGEFELISTPFGSVKQRIDEPEKETRTRTPAEDLAPRPGGESTASATPASMSEPTGSASRLPEKQKEKEAGGEIGQIVFNFDDADLYEVIKTIAEILRINYIVDPNVRGKVTIHTAGGLRKEDLFPVFFQILEANGLTAIKEGSLYNIVQLKDASRMPITSRFGRQGQDVSPEERIVIQIIPLKFISAKEMTKLLTPFISAGGTIISGDVSNTLLVVDKELNILKVLRLVDVFDVNVFEKVDYRFYPLKNVDVEEMVKVFQAIGSSYVTAHKEDIKMIAIEHLNTLLVISTYPQVFEKVGEFIRQLDVADESAEPRIYVYFVKNGQAEDLAELLDDVFGKDSSAKKTEEKWAKDRKKEKAEMALPRNPFARKAKEETKEKAEKAPEAGKESKSAVRSGTSETAGSGTLRGEINITADEIRNALVIEAVPADYRIIENILLKIDVLPRQVLIEAMIAEIKLTKETELGLDWWIKGGISDLSTGLLEASIGPTGIKDSIGRVYSGLKFMVGDTGKWTATLSALAKKGKVNVLSSPHILASDNKVAKIDVCDEIPLSSAEYLYSTETQVTETTIQYRDTGVILSVTPHINERGLVTMEIDQEVSDKGPDMEVAGKKYPSFTKRIIETTLTVRHGQSIVIGGLIKDRKSKDITGLPCLINMPVFRYIFGKESKEVEKIELIILITPHVIVSLGDVDAVTEEFKNKVESVVKMFE